MKIGGSRVSGARASSRWSAGVRRGNTDFAWIPASMQNRTARSSRVRYLGEDIITEIAKGEVYALHSSRVRIFWEVVMKGYLSALSHSLTTSTLLLLAACDAPVEPTDFTESSLPQRPPTLAAEPALFASANLEQQQRAVSAAAIWDADLAFTVVLVILSVPDQACPLVTQTDDTTTVTTGCMRDDGTQLSGQIIVKNWFLDAIDDPIEIFFEDYREAVMGSETLALNGTITSRESSATTSLTMNRGGIEITTKATWNLSDDGRLTADTDSTIEVTGLGIAQIGGIWGYDPCESSGALSLRGADALEVNFDLVVNYCAPMTVDGNDTGQYCTSGCDGFAQTASTLALFHPVAP